MRPGLLTGLNFDALPARALSAETCRHWKYGWTTANGVAVQVAQYADPSGDIVAQKIRTSGKQFAWRGDAKAAGLYGRWLWRDNGKIVVVTEGEIDALSVSQAQGNKWPVVSVPNGAQSAAAAVRKEVDWLERFERVVFMFDNDKPGQEAAKECAALLSPGRAYIATLPVKDANDMLKAGNPAGIVDAIWGAKQYRPDGVLAGSELWDRLNQCKDFEALPYPWPKLQDITRGCRKGEVVTLTAGTGVGKSEVARAVAAHFHDNHQETVGYIALEESVERTALGLMGLHAGRRLHLGLDPLSDADRRAAFDATVGSGRYYLYDHWGSLDGEHLLSRIRFMARGCGCTTIILDHLSIVVSGIESGNERKTIDTLMTSLRSLVQELRIRLILINHLRRIEGTPHEEGGQVSLSHLRGSGSIAQLSDIVVALERDQQSEGGSSMTRLRVLKNRHTGQTGVAGWLQYDPVTGRLSEGEPPTETDSAPGASGAEPSNLF